jgi:hypothetical protein
MAVEKITQKVLLALACCLVLVLVPATAGGSAVICSCNRNAWQHGAAGVRNGFAYSCRCRESLIEYKRPEFRSMEA